MEKKSYVKPAIEFYGINPITSFMVVSEVVTETDTEKAVNMIEACFMIDERVNGKQSNTITDALLEDWLALGNSFIAKTDNKGEANGVTKTECNSNFAENKCYLIQYDGYKWKFTLQQSNNCSSPYHLTYPK